MQIVVDDRLVSIGAARKPRLLLAALLARAGRAVCIDSLTTALWGAEPPRSARRNIQLYAHQLRRMLGSDLISQSDGGYAFVAADVVDAILFDRLAARGSAAAAAGDAEAAVRHWHDALQLWRGPALAEFEDSVMICEEARRLEQLRVDVYEQWALVQVRSDDPGRLTAELAELVEAHPFRESLSGMLMFSLYRVGRQAEALDTFRAMRARLVDQLGIEPGPGLQRLHQAILKGEDVRTMLLPGDAAGIGDSRHMARAPAQLPADAPGFTGRADSMTELDKARADPDGPTRVVLITGPAGVGKTALAAHWATSAAKDYPGGQLSVDLRGFDPAGPPAPPEDVLADFLLAVGVPAHDIPAGAQARASLFRSQVAGRRMLVLLDNARSPDQVRPLLPAGPGCLAIVTSRHRLTSLIADGARAIALKPLSATDARRMLHARLDRVVTGDEAAAADRVAASCAGLPLALAIVAARAVADPSRSLASFAEELDATGGLLNASSSDDTRGDVRTVLSWSYRALSPAAATLFRLLTLHPGPDLTPAVAASLCAVTPEAARAALAELVQANMIVEDQPDRFRLDGLLHAYAREVAQREESPETLGAARQRAIEYYARSAEAARSFLGEHDVAVPPQTTDARPEAFTDLTSALSWFHAEHPALTRVMDLAKTLGLDDYHWRAAWAVSSYHHHKGRCNDRISDALSAMRSAYRTADRAAQTRAHREIAVAYLDLAMYAEADMHLALALDLAADLGDHAGQGDAHMALARSHRAQGHGQEALEQLQQALDHFRAAGNPAAQVAALHRAGLQKGALGERSEATALFRQSINLHLETADRRVAAASWETSGDAARNIGHLEQALVCYRQALDLYRRAGDRSMEATVLIRLAETLSGSGEADLARERRQEAVHILEDIGDPAALSLRERALQTDS